MRLLKNKNIAALLNLVREKKNIAAVLNFLVWGAGYLYLGKRKVLGIGLVISYLVFLLPLALESEMIPLLLKIIVPITLISFLFAYDAYEEGGEK